MHVKKLNIEKLIIMIEIKDFAMMDSSILYPINDIDYFDYFKILFAITIAEN